MEQKIIEFRGSCEQPLSGEGMIFTIFDWARCIPIPRVSLFLEKKRSDLFLKSLKSLKSLDFLEFIKLTAFNVNDLLKEGDYLAQ